MSPRGSCSILRGLAVAIAIAVLGGCQYDAPKDLRPVSSALKMKMDQLGMSEIAPIFIRIFKEESEFEIWKQRRDGKYALLKTYPICKWSGALGPKKKEGDRQAPEGYYTVTPAQMNPNSSYYLSFDIGYPNAYDRALGRTGSNLMVHGACSSRGCYSMTDEIAGEIFALARDAFRGGQRSFNIAAYPFRMTPENMARHRDDPNMPFWRMLKDGYDHFEVTQAPPKVDVCDKRYVFNADPGSARFNATAACPAYTVPEDIRVAVAAKQQADEDAYKVAVARLEEEESRKVAEAERAKEREATKVAGAEAPPPSAKPAADETAAVATPARLSVVEEEEAAPADTKKGRFAFFRRFFGREEAAPAPGERSLGAEFDPGTTAATNDSIPLPVPRPEIAAVRSDPAGAPTVPAPPPEDPAEEPVAASAPPPKPNPATDVESAAAAAEDDSVAEEPAEEPIVEQADAPEPAMAEPSPNATPATASTQTNDAPPAAAAPASGPSTPRKSGAPNFDDVFG